MAKYILTFSTDRPTGSLGGATFQKSGTVFAIRKRNVPVQKKTPRQSEVKNRFDHVQKNWKNLSLAEQQTFIDEATNYPRFDSLGNPYTLLGNNLQGSSNLSLIAAGQPEITSMPPASAIPTPLLLSYAFNSIATLFRADFNPQLTPAGYSLALYFSSTTPQGKALPSFSNMIQIKTFGPGISSFVNIANELNAQFPNRPIMSAPRYAWMQAFYIQLSTGQMGSPYTIETLT